MDKIQELLVTTISPHYSDLLKDIRAVSEPGFTAQNVLEEPKYITVNAYFPRVSEHVDVVYKSLLKNHETDEALKTSDTYTCVENCLVLVLLKRNPWMLKFLHHQLACHRLVRLTCSLCELKKKIWRLKRSMWKTEADEEKAARVKDWEKKKRSKYSR